MPETIQTNIYMENIFWLQIMGDHARFIYNALSPSEKDEIEKAQNLITVFDNLLTRLEAEINAQTTKFNQDAAKAALDIRTFQLHLLSRLLTQGIGFDLQPAMLNHFERETNEYLHLLNYYEKYNNLAFNPMRLHLIWLNDFMGHSAFVQDALSYTYKELREEAAVFENNFETIFIRAMTINEYLETGLQDFPVLKQLDSDAVNLMNRYSSFYLGIQSLINSRRVLGSITILWLDHMRREQCYYETKLSQVTNIQIEQCNPASPRKEFYL